MGGGASETAGAPLLAPPATPFPLLSLPPFPVPLLYLVEGEKLLLYLLPLRVGALPTKPKLHHFGSRWERGAALERRGNAQR